MKSPRDNIFNTHNLSASSLAETTAQHILDAIIEGRLTPDDPFPSQYQLCEWFGVSRTVIREATQILASKGILEVKHGKRITIRPPSHEQMTESVSLAFRRNRISILDVLELRKVLEVETVAYAAKRADQHDIEKIEHYIELMESHISEDESYVNADVAFHRAIFSAARQPAFDLVLLSINDYLIESIAYRRPAVSTKRAISEHRSILEAIKNKDEAAAREAMRTHLEQTLKRKLNDNNEG